MQTYALAELLPRKFRGVGERRTGRLHRQHFLRHRLEIGAEMNRALERDDAAVARLDADVAEHLLVRGLALARREHDANARCGPAPKERHVSQRHAEALEHRTGAGEASVAPAPDGEFAVERRIARDRGLAAEREIDGGMQPRLVGARRARRIDEKAERSVFGLLLD